MTNKKFSIRDAMPELAETTNLIIQRAEERRLAKEAVLQEFKETSDFIIQSRQRRRDRLSKG